MNRLIENGYWKVLCIKYSWREKMFWNVWLLTIQIEVQKSNISTVNYYFYEKTNCYWTIKSNPWTPIEKNKNNRTSAALSSEIKKGANLRHTNECCWLVLTPTQIGVLRGKSALSCLRIETGLINQVFVN